MRVLFSSTWGYGHVFPMIPLARAFQEAGHEVLWATSADSCGIVAAAGLRTAPTGLAGAALRENVGRLQAAAAEVTPRERAAFMFPGMFAELFAPPMVADLLPLAKRWQPDLMIHEHGELASPLVGAVLGAPSLTHSFGGAMPAAIVAAGGDRLASLWVAHGQEVPPYAGCFTSLYLDICPPSVQSVPMDHIAAVQPLRPVSGTGEPSGPRPDYLADDDRPLVYVTLGTVQNRSPILRPVVEALAALPVRLLVTVGPDGDPTSLGEQPAHVRVERWVDQSQVLTRCAVVVSHAGSGTFMGALSAGLPQLCLPQAADQFRNSAGGDRAGAALVLAPDEITGDAVAEAVTRLLAESSYRDRAREVAAEIAAMPPPAEVVDVLVRELA